jgi:hypothetical protein
MTGTPPFSIDDLSFQSDTPSGQQALIDAADAAERQRLEEQAALTAITMASIAEFEAKITELRSNLPKDDAAAPDISASDPVAAGKSAIPGSIGPDPTPSSMARSPSAGVTHPPTMAHTTIPPAAVSTFHDLIGVPDFLSHERSEVELEHSSMQVISKADRLRLSASDKSKVYSNFIKGSINKFKASSTIVGLDEISTIENITSFSELRLELQKHITSISVHPVFLILKFDASGILIDPDTVAGAPVNLLSVNSLPSLSDVEKSILFHYKRGSTFNQENLVWSFEAIRNSCDKELQSIIDAKMLKYKASERFGPLYYYELVQQMTDVDSKAVRAITQELTSLKVPDLEGQSIANVASTIRSTIIWLEMINMVPPDIDAIVYDILETCTVPDFQLYLKTMATTASLNNLKLPHTTLLEKAENHYRTLIISKRWDAAGVPQGSSFQAQHRAQRNNPTNGGGAPATSRAPRYNMPSWNRTPPAESEPHERTFEDKVFKWCGTCLRWFFGDRAHLTSEHVQGHSTTRRIRPSPPTTAEAPSTNAAVAPSVNFAAQAPSASPLAATRNYFTGGL